MSLTLFSKLTSDNNVLFIFLDICTHIIVKLLQEVTTLIDQEISFIVVDDFNCIDKHEEKMGGWLIAIVDSQK